MGWVGWSEKVQKPAYVMYEGSLMKFRLFNVRERPLMMYDFRGGGQKSSKNVGHILWMIPYLKNHPC